MRLNESSDFETKQQYTVCVRVTDGTNHYDQNVVVKGKQDVGIGKSQTTKVVDNIQTKAGKKMYLGSEKGTKTEATGGPVETVASTTLKTQSGSTMTTQAGGTMTVQAPALNINEA